MEDTYLESWVTWKRRMLGGDHLSLSAQGLFSTCPHNKQDTDHCPKCTHHLPLATPLLMLDISCSHS